MQGVRWTEEELAAHNARRSNLRVVPAAAAPVSAPDQAVPAGPAKRAKPKRPEQDLHKACVQLLNAALLPFWRVVHVPNGGQRSPIEAAIMSSMGVRKGFPDLILLGPNRFVVIELKAPGGRGLTAEQAEWRDWFQHIGAMWFLVRSTEELEAACQDAGIPLRVRAQ